MTDEITTASPMLQDDSYSAKERSLFDTSRDDVARLKRGALELRRRSGAFQARLKESLQQLKPLRDLIRRFRYDLNRMASSDARPLPTEREVAAIEKLVKQCLLDITYAESRLAQVQDLRHGLAPLMLTCRELLDLAVETGTIPVASDDDDSDDSRPLEPDKNK